MTLVDPPYSWGCCVKVYPPYSWGCCVKVYPSYSWGCCVKVYPPYSWGCCVKVYPSYSWGSCVQVCEFKIVCSRVFVIGFLQYFSDWNLCHQSHAKQIFISWNQAKTDRLLRKQCFKKVKQKICSNSSLICYIYQNSKLFVDILLKMMMEENRKGSKHLGPHALVKIISQNSDPN